MMKTTVRSAPDGSDKEQMTDENIYKDMYILRNAKRL